MGDRAGYWLHRAEAVGPRLQQWREQLHREPELSNEERRTRRAVEAALGELGIPFRSFADGFQGVVGVLRGARPGPVVLLRADMDGLPVPERTRLPFASTRPGQMHACGHDVHMAAVLGAGLLLRDHPERWRGTVKLLFQPAEEEGTVGGAGPFIARGCLLRPRVDFVAGLHVEPTLPTGSVGWKPGPLFASADRFVIRVHGTGGHAAMPHRGPDAILVAAEIVQGLQALVSRLRDPLSPAVISVGMVHGGTRHNVLPETVELEGTVRTLDAPTRDLLEGALRRRVAAIARSLGARTTVRYVRGYPVTTNDRTVSERVARALERELGAARVHELARPIMGAEDFSRYLERVPGTFLLLGAGGERPAAPLHSSTFAPPPRTVVTGAAILARCVQELSGRP